MENIITVKNDGADKRTDAFAAFMSDVENEMNSLARKDSSFYKKCNAFDLEKCAVETMKMVAPKSEFNPDDINLVSGQSFPDIVLSKQVFGVEVKSTQANHWTSTGSSIVESTRNDYVQYIYMLFGKLGGSTPEFRCKPYEDCLYDIAVTHSPRYLIDMNLKKSDTIFSKMHTTYDEFRNEEHPIKTVVNYYKTQLPPGERLWWMGDDEPEKPTGNIILRFWNYLEMKEKRFAQKDKNLKAATENPFMELYNKLLGFKDEVTIYEPLSKQEISKWEKKYSVKLPAEYKEWLLLSNGARFGNKYIYSLEQVNTEELAIGPNTEKGYVVIADLSGASDILVFDPETAELYVLDDDGDIREGDFESDIFEDGFEDLEDL